MGDTRSTEKRNLVRPRFGADVLPKNVSCCAAGSDCAAIDWRARVARHPDVELDLQRPRGAVRW